MFKELKNRELLRRVFEEYEKYKYPLIESFDIQCDLSNEVIKYRGIGCKIVYTVNKDQTIHECIFDMFDDSENGNEYKYETLEINKYKIKM